MDVYETMMEDDIMALKLMLKQYKNDLDDLENGRGIAKVLTSRQLSEAKTDLEIRISKLEKDLAE